MTRTIKPETGIEYLLCTGGEESFNGIYIGKNTVETPEFIRLLRPEGHVFVREGGGGLEMYCTGDAGEEITLMWNSDGEDGPEWTAGFSVQRADIKLSDLEKEYLTKMIRRLEKQKRTA